MIKIIKVIIKAEIVVIKNFFFNIGSLGAPGSFPNLTFFCFLISVGRTINKINHQKITKITIKVSKNYSCSSSIKVPKKSFGCKNKTGLLCAPFFGVPSPRILTFFFLSSSAVL